MEYNLLIRLIFAHFLSDFLLQNKKLVEMKTNHNILLRHEGLIIHSLVHAVVTYICIADWNSILIPAILFFAHYIVDLIKGRKQGVKVFVVDQCIHLSILVAIWICSTGIDCTLIRQSMESIAKQNNIWLIITAYLLMTEPSSVLISKIIDRWRNDVTTEKGLTNAGAWIGYIERMLILTFVLTHHYEGIGWLLAAKSIFRFGDLNRAKSIKMTEYVLIGTFASFLIAISIGVVTNLVR